MLLYLSAGLKHSYTNVVVLIPWLSSGFVLLRILLPTFGEFAYWIHVQSSDVLLCKSGHRFHMCASWGHTTVSMELTYQFYRATSCEHGERFQQQWFPCLDACALNKLRCNWITLGQHVWTWAMQCQCKQGAVHFIVHIASYSSQKLQSLLDNYGQFQSFVYNGSNIIHDGNRTTFLWKPSKGWLD